MIDNHAPALDPAAPTAKPPGRSGAPRRRPRSIASYLLLLALVTLLPAFLYAAVVLARNNEAQREVVETLVYGTAGSIAQSVDRELSSMLTTLRVLVTLPSLGEGDFRAFHSRAQGALEGSANYMIVLDQQFRQLLNTRVPYGEPLGMTSDPATASLALDNDAAVISNVFFGRTSGHWVFNVALPVELEDGRESVAVLTRNADNLAETLRSQQFPPGWKVALVDGADSVIAASDESLELGQRFFLLGDVEDRRGLIEETVEGVRYLAVVQPSINSGWQVVAWAPRAVLREPFRRSFELLVVGGVLIGAAALLAGAWLSRTIGRSVWRLARDAERLGAGEELVPLDSPITEIRQVSAALVEAARARTVAENEIRFLMREVAHRSKNQLAVISSIAKQTAKGVGSLADFEDAFQKRLQGLSRSTDLMVRGNAGGVELRALIETQIEPFRPSETHRVSLEGPRRRLSIHGAQMLGMAVHELATNAAKYGAFAEAGGRLEVSWRDSGDRLSLTWRERAVTNVPQGGRSGFGTMVIERMVGRSLDAEVERRVHVDGIEWCFEIPHASLDATERDAPERQPEYS